MMEKFDASDILWSLPERKTGKVNVVGGNAQSFATVVKVGEELGTLNLETARMVVPDSLRGKLPPVPEISFAPGNSAGSFKKSPELAAAVEDADAALIIGDLSRNSETAIALAEAVRPAVKPVVVARDAVDLLAPEMGALLEKPNLVLVGSAAQLQKVFRAVYYPKMLLLSMPLVAVVETLHKFTLTYPVTILTFHAEKILVAGGGKVYGFDVSETEYTPVSLWSGALASKIVALACWHPNLLEATAAAVTFDPRRARSA